MASKQETGIGDYVQEHGRLIDQTNKDLNIRPYCEVTIARTTPEGGREVLYVYDLPREMVWEYNWVLEWRKARFVCKYPKDHVSLYFHFYDKTSGLEIGYQTLLSRKVSAKALITKYRNAKKLYIAEKEKELFFDPETDPVLKKADDNIRRAEQRFKEISDEIEKIQKNICTDSITSTSSAEREG